MQRLKTRAQFQLVLAGATVARTPHFALHRCGTDVSPAWPKAAAAQAWMGAMTPKRWARRAVTRNTIRRQIYAVSMAFEAQLPAAAHVVRLRAAFDRREYTSASSEPLKKAVRAELQTLFKRACESKK